MQYLSLYNQIQTQIINWFIRQYLAENPHQIQAHPH